MYSTIAIKKDSKRSGRIIGTHQKLDKIAHKIVVKNLPKGVKFPSIEKILLFEGMGGPDGLKRKSPGKDEPMHFILPDDDDGKLIKMIEDHQYNLRKALEKGDEIRAAFEAAWMAHAVTDGLTPAHHFPLEETQKELMTEKEFIKVFGIPIKGIMHGRSTAETLRNNWLYWGSNGYMSKHIAFEYGAAITLAALPERRVMPKITADELENPEIHEAFYSSLNKIAKLNMYSKFRHNGWTADLAFETRDILLPEIIKAISLCWLASLPKNKGKK
ncbi:hypothetical protein IJ768_01945 [Candidatus Saccharibacteria bacterium]|nr:hypothetical protein [Candidatus Saccharibacteria bacterium]